MPRPSPTSRPSAGQVVMQVARDGGPARSETSGGAVPSRGRHRSPDTGEVPASGSGAEGDAARGGATPTASSAPSRHGVTARQAQAAARRTTPGSMARVEAARAAAERPAASSRAAGPDAPGRSVPARSQSAAPQASAPQSAARQTPAPQTPAPQTPAPQTPAPQTPAPRPGASRSPAQRSAPQALKPRSSGPRAGTPDHDFATDLAAAPEVAPRATGPRAATPDDDAVTDLVAGPTLRGRTALPDGPGTGHVPGLVGLVLGVLALIGAVIAASAPDTVLPVIGRLGASPLALAGLLAAGLLATACAGLGTGRERRGRGVAVTGMVVGLAAVAAAVVPLLALASL